jgi:glycosyltransferase involved in cell wall biosynthesis
MDQIKGDRFNGHSISIGVFAHNEENNILTTLKSLATQDIFQLPLFSSLNITVSVLANGCTDATVSIATNYLKSESSFNGQVFEIKKAGKSHAWNQFVHRPESQDIDYFICVDSDIEFGSSAVLSTLTKRLSHNDEAYLAVDMAKKDTELKAQKNPFERVSLLFSRFMRQGSTAVAGSLYCAKGNILRRVHMPDGLPVEDGFLRAMLVTDLFTQPDNTKRILVVDDVWHYFTPDSSLKSLFRHEERLLIGTFINSVIYGFLWREVPATGLDAGVLIDHRNNAHSDWLKQLIDEYKVKHYFFIPRKFYFKYFSKLKNISIARRIVLFPVILVASLVRSILLVKVERKLAKTSGIGFW